MRHDGARATLPLVPRTTDLLGLAGPLERLRRHRYGPLVEALVDEPSLLVKSMFGCVGCYAHGRLKLVLADRRPPWRGILVPTAHEHHETLRTAVPALAVHPVLRKWLHLTERADDFEAAVERLVALALRDDPRVGVEPPARGRRDGRAARVRRSRRTRAS